MHKFLQNILILSQMWVWKDQELHLQELFDQLFSIHGSPVPLGTPKCAFFWSFPQIKLSLQKERQNWSLSSFYCLGSQVLGRELGGRAGGEAKVRWPTRCFPHRGCSSKPERGLFWVRDCGKGCGNQPRHEIHFSGALLG